MRTITALQEARRILRREISRDIPDYLITFELSSEPDQYRISYELPRAWRPGEVRSIIPGITLTPVQFEDWKKGKQARDAHASGLTESLRKMKEQINGND